MPVEFRPIEAPSTWKLFPRHPAGEDYADLPAKVVRRMQEGIVAYGVMQRPVVLKREQGGMAVLDGWQMYQQCVALDYRPEFVELVGGIEADKFVEIKNDHRRHEDSKARAKRKALQRARLNKGVVNGEPVKDVAQELGISNSEAYRLIGKRCDRCKDANLTGDDCARCQLLRMDDGGPALPPDLPPAPPPPPPEEEPKPVMDALFVTVPADALEAFEVAGELAHMCHEVDGIAKRLAKIIGHKVGARYISPTAAQRFADLREHLWQARATYVCPYCQGGNQECTACRGQLWISKAAFAQAPKEMQDEMRKLGARNVPI